MESFHVFYLPKGSFFQAQTKFDSLDFANQFIQSDIFTKHGFRFDFLLNSKRELLKGNPKNVSEKHFKDAMAFAIPIPQSEYVK